MDAFKNTVQSSKTYANTPLSSLGSGDQQRLEVEDALTYLDRVKDTFKHQPQVYIDFLDTIKQFRANVIDTPGVMTRVCHLFKNHPDLFDGFNAFLPDGFKIEVQHYDEGTGYQVLISMPTHLLLEATHDSETPKIISNGNDYSIKKEIEGDDKNIIYGQCQNFIQDKPPCQPVQFCEAMDYVNKIKNRFETEPAKYRRFLEILHKYQQQQKNRGSVESDNRQLTIIEVYNQVAELFEPGDELLEEFGRFFPD